MVPWWLPGCRPPALAAGPVAVAAVTAGALVGLDIAYRHAARGRRMFSRLARRAARQVGRRSWHGASTYTGKRATCSWPASTICVCARAISPADDRPWIDVLLVRFWRSGSAGTRPATLPYAFDSCWLRTGGGGRGRGPRGVRRLCAARGAACTGSGVVQPTRSVSMTRTTMKPVRVRGTLDPQLPPHRWLRCY